jgi:hypothetical protein
LRLFATLTLILSRQGRGILRLTISQEALTWFAGKPIGTGKASQLTKKLMAAYKELVREGLGRSCRDKYYGIEQELSEERKVSRHG